MSNPLEIILQQLHGEKWKDDRTPDNIALDFLRHIAKCKGLSGVQEYDVAHDKLVRLYFKDDPAFKKMVDDLSAYVFLLFPPPKEKAEASEDETESTH